MIRQASTMFKLEYLKLCNLSLRTGRLPKRWKTVKLVPIPKTDGTIVPIIKNKCGNISSSHF